MSADIFATIITMDHLDKAMALLASLQKFGEAELHVFIVDLSVDPRKLESPGLIIHEQPEFLKDSLNKIILTKYTGYGNASKIRLPQDGIIAYYDYLRWALKPAFVKLLHEQFERVIYCDCDLFFYNDYKFLADMLDEHRIVISPHWREITPIANTDYRYNYLHGLYNGGFFATRDADDFLIWWREMCAIECTAESTNGTYVDQKYLDVVPLYFDDVGIIRHPGCNVAGWNLYHLRRGTKDGETTINDEPIIFIHYSPVTINKIEGGEDFMLQGHLQQYEKQLMETRIELTRRGLKFCISTPAEEAEVI